ncbi:MAG: hypothetical protein KDK96_10915, partial [Chlamydiia bacterium]|nr:hypothetical protein [Chlamydiia bacterium]
MSFSVINTMEKFYPYRLSQAKENLSPSRKNPSTGNSQAKHSRSQDQAWRPNRLPNNWEKLKKSPNWRKLSKLEQQILKLGWPNRHLQLSYSEIATLLNIQRNAAIRLMQKLEKMEFVTKKKNFIQKKNGNYTKIHKRNYYVFTDAGKAGIEILLNRLFLHGQNEPLKNLTNVRKGKPSESSISQVHPRNEKFSEIRKSFEKYSFEGQLSRAYKGTLRILLEHPMEIIEKILKLMRRKIQKGWKLREFWGFFLKQLKGPKKVRSFFPYLAHAYLEASTGKYNSMTHGVDSSIIAESLGKLQKTGEVILESKLAHILSYGTQKVKIALEGICYRSYIGRGVLPKPKAEIKNPQKTKKHPIKDLVKINARTGEIYSVEDYKNREEFSMKAIIVGYEEIESPRKEKKIPEKAPSTKIRSWIGLLINTLESCKDCESIHRR